MAINLSISKIRFSNFLCLGIGLLGILGSLLPILSDAEENLGLHLLYHWRGPVKPQADVVVVAIDRESASKFNLPAAANKWPRSLHARLLKKLTALGAAVVAFDLIFQDPQSAADDQRFAAAIADADNVILTQPIARRIMSFVDPTDTRTTNVNIEKMVSAIPAIAKAALGQAPFPLPKIPVKLNRFWRFCPGSGDIPTLPVVVLQAYAMDAFDELIGLLKQTDPEAVNTLSTAPDGKKERARRNIDTIRFWHVLFEKDPTLADRMIAELDHFARLHPDSKKKRLARALIESYAPGHSRYLNLYGPPGTIKTIPYHRLLDPDDLSFGQHAKKMLSLNGKAVFVGQTESDWVKANDGFYTAFTDASGKDISGVEIAATAFSNLLEGKAVRPLRPTTHFTVLFVGGVVLALVSLNFSTSVSAVGLLLLNAIYLLIANSRFTSGGIWYPLVIPILVQTPSAFMTGLVWKYHQAKLERRNIYQAFGHYLPDEVVDRLAANIKNLHTDGQVLYSICLVTDAESYTTLSEKLDPEGLTQVMNTYYKFIFKPIKDNGGFILQVIGDSILALWTAPRPKNELKDSAASAAVGITKAVRRYNASAGSHQLPTRIGIHAGEILLGNIGAMDHLEYRPVGDIVNTASRLEGLNKYLGTCMLTSKEALGLKKSLATRLVGRFVFKGKSQPVQVYEILPNNVLSTKIPKAVHQKFKAGLKAFERQRWDEADQYFQAALQIDQNDGPSKFYQKLCRKLRHDPPNESWNGTVHLNEK
jgi:adenylate cyclase